MQSFHCKMIFVPVTDVVKPTSLHLTYYKNAVSVVVQLGFINSFNSYFVLYFAIPCKSLSKREILVDGAGKKDWTKLSFHLTRA